MRKLNLIIALLGIATFVVAANAQQKVDLEMVARLRPADEASLMIYEQALKDVNSAPNDIVKQQRQDHWDSTFCGALKRLKSFDNWTGTVSEIRWNGFFQVNIGDYIKLSDITIEPETPLFKVISHLRERQPVKVSGKFDTIFCDNVWTSREHTVRFTRISPL